MRIFAEIRKVGEALNWGAYKWKTFFLIKKIIKEKELNSSITTKPTNHPNLI